ncbi:MAG TPA: hypothetical protein VII06_24830 [Chloroflexota bacterium]
MFDELLLLPWRAYPALVLVLVGAGLVAAGVWAGASYWGRQQTSPQWAMAYLTVFRRVVVGLALVGAGAGWWAQVPGLVGAGLCIAVGEFLESTYYIEVMRWGQRHRVSWLVPMARPDETEEMSLAVPARTLP